MRTVTRTYEVYPFSELSEKGRQYALLQWQSNRGYPWADDNMKTLDAFCSLFNITCHNWEYDSCNYHYSFSTSLDEAVEKLSGIRLLKYLVNNYWSFLFTPKLYYKEWEKRRASRILRTNSCVLTGYSADEDILRPLYAFLSKPVSVTFHSLLNDCLDSFFRGCRDDYDYYYSEESLRESSEANGWEYLASGKKFS